MSHVYIHNFNVITATMLVSINKKNLMSQNVRTYRVNLKMGNKIIIIHFYLSKNFLFITSVRLMFNRKYQMY